MYSTTFDLIARDASYATILHDGVRLSFTDFTEDGSDIVRVNPATGDRTILEHDPRGFAPHVDPTGRWIASTAKELVISEIGTGERREILAPGEGTRIEFLDWSFDGSLILVATVCAGGSELLVVDVETGERRFTKALPFGDAAFWINASFRRDRREIAFDGPLGADKTWNVATVSTEPTETAEPEDESAPNIVTSPGRTEILLGYGPDPGSLVVARDESGRWDAVLVAPSDDGSYESTQVLKRDFGEIRFRGSNSGYRRYAVETFSWSNSVEILELESSGTVAQSTTITSALASGSRATWNVDGESVLFAAGSGQGARGFRLMLAKDGAAEDFETLPGVMRFGGHAFEPRLSPDGTRLLFQAPTYSGGRLDSNGIYTKWIGEPSVRPIVRTEGICPI